MDTQIDVRALVERDKAELEKGLRGLVERQREVAQAIVAQQGAIAYVTELLGKMGAQDGGSG